MTVSLTSLAGPASASAPAVVAGVPGLGNPIAVVLAQGWTYTGVQFYRTIGTASPVAISGATSSPYTQVAADIPAIGAADIVITALLTGLTYSPPAGVTNSSQPTAPSFSGQPTVNAVPQEGVPLSITWANASGAPTPTVTRSIYAGATLVAGPAATVNYTPPAGAAGTVYTASQTATNAGGTVSTLSDNSAPCIPGATPTTTVSHAFNGAAFSSATFN